MATNYPTALDTLTNPNPTDKVDVVSHSDQHANANDSIEALEAKVGVDGSAVTSTHDYKLSGVTGADKSASVTGTETLTNKTLTSPVLNTPDINGGDIDDADITNPTLNGTVQFDLGSDATGDMFYRGSGGALERIPIGSNGQVQKIVSGEPTWADPASSTTLIEGTAGTTHSLTTTASNVVFVVVKGSFTGTSSPTTVSVAYNGVTKDSVYIRLAGSSDASSFTLTYFETPGSATNDITVSTTTGTISQVKINVLKL